MITEEIKTLLRAIRDGKQMQAKVIGYDKWKDYPPEEILGFITTVVKYGSIEVRIKPEPVRMYGKMRASINDWHFNRIEIPSDTHYFDIDPDTNEPIGPIQRIQK